MLINVDEAEKEKSDAKLSVCGPSIEQHCSASPPSPVALCRWFYKPPHRLALFLPLCEWGVPAPRTHSLWPLNGVTCSISLIHIFSAAASLWPSRKHRNIRIPSNSRILLLPLHYNCPLSNQGKLLKSFLIASILSAKSSFVLLNTRANDLIIRSSHWSHEPYSEVPQPHSPTAKKKGGGLFNIFNYSS